MDSLATLNTDPYDHDTEDEPDITGMELPSFGMLLVPLVAGVLLMLLAVYGLERIDTDTLGAGRPVPTAVAGE